MKLNRVSINFPCRKNLFPKKGKREIYYKINLPVRSSVDISSKFSDIPLDNDELSSKLKKKK